MRLRPGFSSRNRIGLWFSTPPRGSRLHEVKQFSRTHPWVGSDFQRTSSALHCGFSRRPPQLSLESWCRSMVASQRLRECDDVRMQRDLGAERSHTEMRNSREDTKVAKKTKRNKLLPSSLCSSFVFFVSSCEMSVLPRIICDNRDRRRAC